ncbi:hypothetical protein C8263_07205 [Deinococcus arcticus]|uniref:Uncharacterized protein n=1 Tax=Deinococcus arcticus TaxID=2136176 RepID=A0A2T3W9Z5_9DEIO|nr:hypothetical protein C8263_07205 [Deinococcus arcticus]
MDTVSGVAVLYRGAVNDAFERYAEALTSAGFTVVSSTSTPLGASATAGAADTETPADGDSAAGSADAAGGAAATTAPAATTPPADGSAAPGTSDTAADTEPAAPGADQPAAAAPASGRTRQVMVLERNGEQIRLTVYQAYGVTTVLLARI